MILIIHILLLALLIFLWHQAEAPIVKVMEDILEKVHSFAVRAFSEKGNVR